MSVLLELDFSTKWSKKEPMTQPIVSLVFDDGWKSAIQNAFPLLQKFGIPATFYIISKCLNDESFPQYINKDDLEVLREQGHEIGSHTRSHAHLPELSEEAVWEEIAGGAEDLRSCGFSPSTFAYPYGEWNPYVVKQVREAGFFAARSIERGTNNQKTNPFLLRACGVRENHSSEEVASWIEEGSKMGEWLILYLHQIEPAQKLRENKWIYGSTPQVLESILAYLRERAVKVLTVEQGMHELLNQTLL